MEDTFQKELERSKNISVIWKELQNRDIDINSILISDKDFYIEKLKKLMSDEEEKWRDFEGKEFYNRVNDFINKLDS